MTKIDIAKSELILRHPFFATLLLSMELKETDSTEVPTMATDGETIYWNKNWTQSLKGPEVLFVLAHETLHCVLSHMTRRGNRNANKWNIAADYVINDLLVKEKVGQMPKGGLFDPAIVAQGKGSAEGIYNVLPKDNETKESGKPGQGGSLDKVLDAGRKPGDGKGANAPMDKAKAKQLEGKTRVNVIRARNTAKAHGRLSAAIDDFIGGLLKSKVDWRFVLRRFLSERSKEYPSYAKPKRRFLGEDYFLPGLVGERLGALAVAVDESGSIGQKQLQAFATELNSILEDTTPPEIRVIHFADKVAPIEIFTPSDLPINLKAKISGGTRFSPIFREIDTWGNAPVACIVLTDLQATDFGQAPNFPVLWITTDSTKAPFGEIVKMESEES